jgi:cobalt/nickel transport system permease protein
MHHVVLEQWTRRASAVHALDPRCKLLATLAFLLALGTAGKLSPAEGVAYAAFAGAAVGLARLPAAGVTVRAAAVLPFSGFLALFRFWEGDAGQAVSLLLKSYLSAFCALVLVGTTPLPRLLDGLERLGAPRMFVLVVQFLYRYLFVISEQGQHMRQAALSRGGFRHAARRVRLRAAAGAVAILFARSYRRAEAIYRAMLARGFEGRLAQAATPAFRARDAAALALVAAVLLAVRLQVWTAW